MTFKGGVIDRVGNPVPGIEVSINEKDLFGLLVPIKDSEGNPVIGHTDNEGLYSLTDDDGWPDGGAKVVWAHAYDSQDVVSEGLGLYVLGIPYLPFQPTRWPIPLITGAVVGVVVVGYGAYSLWQMSQLIAGR